MTNAFQATDAKGSTRRRPTWLIALALTVGLASTVAFAASAADHAASIAVRDPEGGRGVARPDPDGRRGFLYDVAGPAANPLHLFLYGTIHVGRTDSEPFNAAVTQALRRSRRIALEADPTDTAVAQRLVVELGRYGDGDGLERHLPPPLMARVEAFAGKAGIPKEQVARYRPWLLANMVTLQRMDASGLDPALGSELHLARYAHDHRMPIVEIEGMAAQLRLLARLPDALQAAQLDEALAEVDADADADDEDDTRALFEVWRSGDATAAEALLAQMHEQAQAKPYARWFVDTLVDDRNRTMADRAELELARPGATFFAVGALHLFGETGLIRTLERRGYRVTDLQAPPPAR